MDDTIKIRGGSGETPTLQERELGYNKTEGALYIGTPDGNVRLCGKDDIEETKKYAYDLMRGLENNIYVLMEEVNRRLKDLENKEEPEPEPEEPDPPDEGGVNE